MSSFCGGREAPCSGANGRTKSPRGVCQGKLHCGRVCRVRTRGSGQLTLQYAYTLCFFLIIFYLLCALFGVLLAVEHRL